MADITKEAQEARIVLTSEEIKLGRICAIQATNRQALVDKINELVNSSFFNGDRNKTYLHVALSGEQLGCGGCSADYATEADVPHHSVPCPCGNPDHWLIKYELD